MEKHFVTFYMPGTFVAERSTEPIDSWNVKLAAEMARELTVLIPYAFQFTTRSREDDELDSRVSARSGTYYLGGVLLSLEQVKARNDEKDRILISNMENNDWGRVIQNDNSWRVTQQFGPNDVVLEWSPNEGVTS